MSPQMVDSGSVLLTVEVGACATRLRCGVAFAKAWTGKAAKNEASQQRNIATVIHQPQRHNRSVLKEHAAGTFDGLHSQS